MPEGWSRYNLKRRLVGRPIDRPERRLLGGGGEEPPVGYGVSEKTRLGVAIGPGLLDVGSGSFRLLVPVIEQDIDPGNTQPAPHADEQEEKQQGAEAGPKGSRHLLSR